MYIGSFGRGKLMPFTKKNTNGKLLNKKSTAKDLLKCAVGWSGNDLDDLLCEVEELRSPLMPPKSKFKVIVRVKSIKRGRPSICDEIEYED